MVINDNQKDLMGKLLFGISLILLGVMIYLVFTKPFLSVDEWFTKGLVNFRFADVVSLTALDVHPPLYYIIVKLFTKPLALLNIHYNAIMLLKFVSIVPYIIILLVSLTKIRKEYGWFSSGLMVFCLLSMANFFTYYLTARMYSWSLLFILLSFIYASSIFEAPNIKDWILLSIFSVLGAYTMYMNAVASISLYLILLIYIIFNNRSQIKNFIISCIINVVLYVPWLFTLLDHLGDVQKHYWIKTLTIDKIINAFATIFPNLGFELSCLFTVILVALAILLFKRYADTRETTDLYILSGVLVFILNVIITVVVSFLYKPVLIPRILIPAAGVFWFSFSLAFSRLKFNRTVLLVTLLIIVIGAVGVIQQVNDISGTYDETVANHAFLNEINNNDTIIIYVSLTKFARFYEDLDNTHQYYCYKIDNNTTTKKYVKILNLSKDAFDIPNDVIKNNDKNIYFIGENKDSNVFPDDIRANESYKIYNCVFLKLDSNTTAEY